MNKNRWNLKEHGITWDIQKDNRLPHRDHLEMSGTGVSLYMEYGVEENGFLWLLTDVVFPTLRTIPNNTHASLTLRFTEALFGNFTVNGVSLSPEKPERVCFDGVLTIQSITKERLEITREVLPARTALALVEQVTLKNRTDTPMIIGGDYTTSETVHRGSEGIYLVEASSDMPEKFLLQPGETVSFGIYIQGRKLRHPKAALDACTELRKRREFITSLQQSLQLNTPDPVLNQAFFFTKLRTCESVFLTKAGYLHSPGGRSYYAAIWTNDQVEYAGPLAPFIGEPTFFEASINAYRLFMPFMGPNYRAIPSSIIAEGQDIWEGAGDRGDAAMYAYGASQFALFSGSRELAEELYPAIVWCLEYCRRMENEAGVICSDSDELEGRFSTGTANLSTTTLCYGGLVGAAALARALEKEADAVEYEQRATALRNAIERYFGGTVEGFQSYRYHEGNEKLRSWICLPLTMGITERKEETIKALLSPQLWTADGLATQSGEITFWDRSTLYGFRGVLSVESNDWIMAYLKSYSERRTLGEHVPYPVEAYPEGGQRHLSAESALYCRIFTEGMFGIRPTGLKSFTVRPNIPKDWPSAELRNIKAFGSDFDLLVRNQGDQYQITIHYGGKATDYTVEQGGMATIHLV